MLMQKYIEILKKRKKKEIQSKQRLTMLNVQILFTVCTRVYLVVFFIFFFLSLNTGELKNLVSENLSPRLILLQSEEIKYYYE